VPLGAEMPSNDPVFESVSPSSPVTMLPRHPRSADLLGWLLSSPANDTTYQARVTWAVPSLFEGGSIVSNSSVATFMALLVEFRRYSLNNGITWVALRDRQRRVAPFGTDKVGIAAAEMSRINMLLDSFLASMPDPIRTCIVDGDAQTLCATFGSAWGVPNREKFASQMLLFLSFQCVAKSHMCVGREAGNRGGGKLLVVEGVDSSEEDEPTRAHRLREEELDERAFVESGDFLEATRYAIMGTQLVRSLLQVNATPQFLSQSTAVAMLRIGYVHLLAFKTLTEAARDGNSRYGDDAAAREAVLSQELLNVCTYVMNLAVKFVSFGIHGMQPSRDLLEEVEATMEQVRDVLAEGAQF
jgi:hypothetical protein